MRSKRSIDTNSIATKLMLLFLLFFIINNFQTYKQLTRNYKKQSQSVSISHSGLKHISSWKHPQEMLPQEIQITLTLKLSRSPPRHCPGPTGRLTAPSDPQLQYAITNCICFIYGTKTFLACDPYGTAIFLTHFPYGTRTFFAPPFDRFPVLYPP